MADLMLRIPSTQLTCEFFGLFEGEVLNIQWLAPPFGIDRVDVDSETGLRRQVAQMEGGRVTGGIVAELGRVPFVDFQNEMLCQAAVVTLITTQFHGFTCLVKYGTVGHGGRLLCKS